MKREAIKCARCDFVTKRIAMNTSISRHYAEAHDTNDELTVYVDVFCGGVHPTCKCGCGQKLRWYGWTKGFQCLSINGHDNPWRGKTKETDERLAQMGAKVSKTRKELMDAGEITIWSKGKTKETDERVAAMSETFKEQFASGERVAWHAGLTAETDERVAAAAKKQSELWQSGVITQWHKGKDKTQLPSLARSKELVAAHAAKVRLTWEEILQRLSLLKYTKLISTYEEYTNSQKKCLRLQCTECGTIEKKNLYTALTDRCDKCNPQSAGEREWLDSLGVPVDCRNRWIFLGDKRFNVDGLINSTIYEYYGDYWHGNPKTQRPDTINHLSGISASEYYRRTMEREKILRDAGYVVVTMWESDWMNLRKSRPH